MIPRGVLLQDIDGCRFHVRAAVERLREGAANFAAFFIFGSQSD